MERTLIKYVHFQTNGEKGLHAISRQNLQTVLRLYDQYLELMWTRKNVHFNVLLVYLW